MNPPPVDIGENVFDHKGHAEDKNSEECVGKVAISLCETHERGAFLIAGVTLEDLFN